MPILVEVAGTVLRGSIDLLVEADGAPPLIVDYKTDRLDGAEPAELAGRYEIQQAIYALAVAEARGAPEVEVAYVFLERPEEPVVEFGAGAGGRGAGTAVLESGASPRVSGTADQEASPAADASSFSASSSSFSSLRPSPTASSSAAQ